MNASKSFVAAVSVGIAAQLSGCSAVAWDSALESVGATLESVAAASAERSDPPISASGIVAREVGQMRLGDEPRTFAFPASSEEEYVLISVQAGFAFRIYNPTGNAEIHQRWHPGKEYPRATSGRFQPLETGTHSIEVRTTSWRNRGPRGFEYYIIQVDRRPSHGNETISMNQIVEGEHQHEHDIDEYRLQAQEGDRISLTLQALDGTNRQYRAFLEGPSGDLLDVTSRGDSPAFDTNESRVVPITRSGEHRVRVEAPVNGYGNYRFRVNHH